MNPHKMATFLTKWQNLAKSGHTGFSPKTFWRPSEIVKFKLVLSGSETFKFSSRYYKTFLEEI